MKNIDIKISSNKSFGKVFSILFLIIAIFPLLNNENIACTPHVGAATIEAQDRIGTELADTIISNFGTF